MKICQFAGIFVPKLLWERIMVINEKNLKKVHGYEEGRDVLDAASLSTAAEYKKNVLKNFTAFDQNQITERFGEGEYYVTRKYDGEYAIIYYQDGETVTVNRSGRTRRGLPCIEEAGRLIAAAGIRQGIFPAEIYVEADRKTRVNDLISALAHQERIGTLRLAVFDILEIDGHPFRNRPYPLIWNKLHDIFGPGTLCHDVDFRIVGGSGEISALWRQWVDKEGSEGLIVHTRTGLSFKIKPRHYFDVVVLAYREGTGGETGQVRTMLYGFMPAAGKYQVMSRVGSGLNEALRKQLFGFFRGKAVPNPFTGLNTNWEEMVFVRPQLVIEIAVEEAVTELATGEKTNYLLDFDGERYRIDGIVPGYRTYTPVFVRLREDKSADETDAGTGQLQRYIAAQRADEQLQVKSEVLLRDVLSHGGPQPFRLTFVIWKAGDEFVMLTQSSDKGGVLRDLVRSQEFYPLFNRYQRQAADAVSNGFQRETDKVITTESCIEIMQTEPEYA